MLRTPLVSPVWIRVEERSVLTLGRVSLAAVFGPIATGVDHEARGGRDLEGEVFCEQVEADAVARLQHVGRRERADGAAIELHRGGAHLVDVASEALLPVRERSRNARRDAVDGADSPPRRDSARD